LADGGPGSSSAPASRSKPLQPLAGVALTLELLGAIQAAAVAPCIIPPK
jgi:hypothetical protein